MKLNLTMTMTPETHSQSAGAVAAARGLRGLRQVATVIAFGAAALLVGGQAPPVLAQNAVVVDVVAVAQGYRFGDLKGHAVINKGNESIGTLDDLIITHDKALFAILEVGGFLGIGAHFVAVPFDALTISADGKTITASDASKAQLGQLPEFKYAPPAGGTSSASSASSAAK